MPRLEIPPAYKMTPAQAEVCTEAAAGLRGKVPTPMLAWMRNPELARRAQSLGELLRFQTSLSPLLFELAVVLCAKHWMSHLAWTAHKAIGIRVGLPARIVDDIAAGRKPVFSDASEQAVHDVSSVLLSSGRLPRTLYDRVLPVLGETALVELVGVLGYYSMVSLTANAFEMGLPENKATELNDPDFYSA